MNNRNNKRSTQQHDDHGSNHPAKLLYLPAEPFDNVQGTIKKLAEKASENVSTWRSRLENRVLSLNYAAREEPTSLAGYQPIQYTVRHPYSKFCGLSNRAAKRAGLLKHPKTIPYEHAILLHNLWTEYVTDVLGKHTQPAHIARSLALCDLQGAIIDIQSSQCPSYVGVKGIILTETQNVGTLDSVTNVIGIQHRKARLKRHNSA
eukprot:XP_001611054.1 hypothetical protein [Babesia bovis T2Bo]